MSVDAVVSIVGIEKSFEHNKVLRGVNLDIEAGELHALIGANGSGKSTLVKILTGNYQPDAGQIRLSGRYFPSFRSPLMAAQLGVRVVHQEAPLVDSLPVAECMALLRAYPVTRYGRVQWRELRRRAAESLGPYASGINLTQLAGLLAPAQRAYVAFSVIRSDVEEHGAGVLVLDEVTAPVPEADADELLRSVVSLSRSGLPVLMVTHRLGEVERYAQRVTVLRDGAVVYSGEPGAIRREQFVSLITGSEREVSSESSARLTSGDAARFVRHTGTSSDGRLRLSNVAVGPIERLSFEVQPGEVLGLVGAPDSGIEGIPLALVGLTATARGEVRLGDDAVSLPLSPRRALKLGIALVPRDRLRQGLIGNLTVAENILLPRASQYWHQRRAARAEVASVITGLDVRPRDPKLLARFLSGGNQQKIIIGKWLTYRPRILILDDPGSGVDPAARAQIFAVVRQAACQGLGVLLLSSEPQELSQYCNRVLAVGHYGVVAELAGKRLSYEEVARWAVVA